MSQRTVLHVSSADRVYGTTSDFVCRFKPVSDVVAFSVNSVELPHTFFNIRLGVNDTLIIEVAATPHSLVVAPGFYTLLELGSALAVLMAAHTTTATATVSEPTGTITFATNDAMKITYVGSTMASA